MSIHKKLKALKKANELEAQIKNEIKNPPSFGYSDGESWSAERNEYFSRLNRQLKEVQSIQARIKAN
tara:strand:- start:1493 stop:1693 length:201 start_codon:yes stop_codon:yes gene_type:complete